MLVMAQAEDATGDTLIRVFLEDIPIHINANELGVYLDLDRLVAAPPGVDVEDRAYVFDLETGAVVFRSPQFFLGATGWQDGAAPDPFDGVLGECRVADGELSPVRVCDAELSVRISRPLGVGLPEAPASIGIALSDDRFSTVLPPELTDLATLGGDPTLDRRNFVTIFLTPPTGPSLKFISWNVRRFGPLERVLLGSDPFASVNEGNQAQFIWDADVIALQEVWSHASAIALRDSINAIRDVAFLPEMHVYGPVQPDVNVMRSIADLAQQTLLPVETEWHGGLYILSHYPQLREDHLVYSECRGEDCLKAKGVQWVRLALNAPTQDNTDPACIQNVPGAGCPHAPTSQHFIDVFNTHLQAGNPQICEDGAVFALAVELGLDLISIAAALCANVAETPTGPENSV